MTDLVTYRGAYHVWPLGRDWHWRISDRGEPLDFGTAKSRPAATAAAFASFITSRSRTSVRIERTLQLLGTAEIRIDRSLGHLEAMRERCERTQRALIASRSMVAESKALLGRR